MARTLRLCREVDAFVPPHVSLILVDSQFTVFPIRDSLPFLEREGLYCRPAMMKKLFGSWSGCAAPDLHSSSFRGCRFGGWIIIPAFGNIFAQGSRVFGRANV